MSELSPYYAMANRYDYDSEADIYRTSVTYNYNDSSHPDTYQSFNITGKGTIDQSIFWFKRRNDIWSLGAHLNEFAEPIINSAQFSEASYTNNLKRNNSCMAVGISQYCDPYRLITQNQYSPVPQNSGGGCQFFINYMYNKFCILPFFDIVSGGSYSGGGTYYTGLTYNQAKEYDHPVVTKLTLQYSYGGYQLTNMNPLFLQYAGTIKNSQISTHPTFGDDVQAVLNVPHHTWLFGNIATDGQHLHSRCPYIGWTQAVFLDIISMGCKENSRVINNWAGGSIARLMAIPLDDAVKILDSLGYYWSMSSTYDGSELGAYCQDPNMRVPLIDPTTHEVTETVLEGTDIAVYAMDHPESNVAMDVGAVDMNGFSVPDWREPYHSDQDSIEEADEIDLVEPTIATAGGNSMWLMSQNKVTELFTFMWDPDGNHINDILQGVFLFGNNPMDCMVSLRLYPILNLSNYLTGEYHALCFGRRPLFLSDGATYLSNFNIQSTNVIILDVGEFYFNDAGMFNDYRDYEPYSQYSLYIPFCGIISLQAMECINTTIKMKMIVDLITGSCTAVVYTNNVPYKYIDGVIGIEIPMTGRNVTEYAKTVLGAALGGGALGGHAGTKGGPLTKFANKMGAANQEAVESMAEGGQASQKYLRETQWEANAWKFLGGYGSVAAGTAFAVGSAAISGGAAALSNAPAVESAGSNTPAVGLAKPMYPYFIVKRSDTWKPENWNELYGKPLFEGGTVGDFNGYSEFANLRLDDISYATSEEKTMISQLLTTGVYL